MFQEKELYFFENSTKTVESQKVIVVPKIKAGDSLNSDQYLLVEEMAGLYFSNNNIYPREIVKSKNNLIKVDRNYYFSDKKICGELGKSSVLQYFQSPKKIAHTLKIYIGKTDLILKKIFTSLPQCKKLEDEIINDLSFSYSNDKLDFVGLTPFFIQSLNAVQYISCDLLKNFCTLNADLENIKNIFIYRENRDIIGILYSLMDLILKYDNYIHPIKYIEEDYTPEISPESQEFKYFFIDSDDISEFLDKIRERKDTYKNQLII